jgi:hypothetical protein
MPEIRRRLGYRFRLIDSSAQAEGSQLRVSVTVQNDGFADLYNPRAVFLILRNRGTGATQRVRVSSDPPAGCLPSPRRSTSLPPLSVASTISCCICPTPLPLLAVGPSTLFA